MFGWISDRKMKNEAKVYSQMMDKIREEVRNENGDSKTGKAYKRLFEAAQFNRLTSSWTAISYSPNQELYNDLAILKIRSRDLFSNSPVINNFVTLLQNNVVGDKGFQFRSLVKDKEIATKIQDEWNNYCKKGNLEASGKYGINNLLDLAIISLAIDGEIIVRKYPRMGKYNFQIELLHSEQLILTQHKEYFMGIQSDEFGKPISYCITDKHPSEGFIKYQFIPANQILHSFIPYQVGASRGVPMIFSVMPTIKRLEDYRKAEAIAANIQASKYVTYTQTQPDDLDAEMAIASMMLPGTKRQTIEPGMAEILPPGVDAKYVQSTHPTTQFPDFCKSLQKEVSAGLGISYNSLYSDFENTSFSSMRAAFVTEKAFYKKIQNIIVETLLTPLFESWLDCACASGVLNLPPVMGNYDYYKNHDFIGKAIVFSNPLQEINAAVIAINNRTMSKTQFCLDQGFTYEEVCRDIKNEQDIEKSTGINFEIVPKNSVIAPVPDGVGTTPIA